MSPNSKSFARHPPARRLWKPVVATGVSGAAVVIWLEELIAFGAEILALIFLTVMAGVIYLLDIFFFNSRMPDREDVTHPNDQGVEK
jgi:predicted membrane channel-forming protein YqfA (hemolysin III family)